MHHRRWSEGRKGAGDAAGRARTVRRERRSKQGRRVRFVLLAGQALLLATLLVPAIVSGAPTATADVTIVAQNLAAVPISDFTFLISEDNAGRRTDPVDQRPGVKPTPSYIPLVAAGDQDTGPVTLESGMTCGPDNLRPCRYLVTVKAAGHKLWGKHFALPANEGDVVVQLKAGQLPLGKLVVHAFQDTRPVNAAPDATGTLIDTAGDQPLSGFEVRLHDTVGEMQADFNGNPLCGGQCVTGPDGNVTIDNVPPGRYELEVLPPDGTDWVQTTTFEGTHLYDFVRVTENDDGLGAIGEAAVAAGIPTAWWFGFVQPLDLSPCPSCGSVSGTARTWVGWPPYDTIDFGDPVREAIVALSDVGGNDEQVYTRTSDPDPNTGVTNPNPDTGEFSIENIPDGTYTLSIFDRNLDFLMRYVTFTLPNANQDVNGNLDLNTLDVNGESGIAVARWFGWNSGYVFEDNGLDAGGVTIPGAVPGNGIRECELGNPDRCEDGIDGIDLDLRFRDGSVKSATFTNPNPYSLNNESGYYEYPELLNPLSKFLISEVGFGRFARTGSSQHDEFDPTIVSDNPDELGGGLLLNELVFEGHRSWVDWGKREYALDDPSTPAVYEGEHGGITGIVYHATTRNEFDPSLAGAEDYEPGIPADTTINLYGPGQDRQWDTSDDVLVNTATVDAWSHPRMDAPTNFPQSCDVRDASGAVLPPFNPDIGRNCIEFPTISNQTKEGAFDGGYAIETMLNHPITNADLSASEPLLLPGDYVVEVVPPAFYQVIKEEDQNTDEGDDLVPQIPPPPCVGPLHLVNDLRNPADGQYTPLCTRKLVTLDDGQNPAADFFLFTDHDADPTTNTSYDDPTTLTTNEDVSWNTVESVAPPGRIFGFVGDDIRFDTDPTSPWFGQPMALPNIPVGVYDYTGRLLTMLYTDEWGFFDVTLPSTQTYLCPTPAGVCPGMYVLRMDDPADPLFNPDYLTAVIAFDVWPGKTTLADVPVDPISALACTLGVAPEGQAQQPEFFRVSNPYITRSTSTANQGQRELTIDGAGFGATQGSGRVFLGGTTTPFAVPLGTPPNLNYLSWMDRQIRVRVPNNFVLAGPQQLLIRRDSGEWTPLGITIHVRATGGYNPTVVEVNKGDAIPTNDSIQAAIDAAPPNGPGTLIVVRPGTYVENVILHKKVKLQGVGPGGTIAAPESANPDDVRFEVVGAVINARNFFDREITWDAKLDSLRPFAGNDTVPGGAAITVVPTARGQFTNGHLRAGIDGFGITLGQSLDGGAGGIQVNAFARFLQISNNILENNGGGIGGGIALGTPHNFMVGVVPRTGPADNENDDIRIAYNRILGNGALSNGGGVAVYNGADRFVIERNQICSNYSVTYGAGVGVYGSSGGTNRIEDNNFYGNEAFDSGGALMVSGEVSVLNGGVGTGRVDVKRNYIQFNLSNDDGGGMFIRDTSNSRIDLMSNMVNDNVATDVGGGIALDDVPNARIVNNTIAFNATTDTSEDRDLLPNGAGLVSEANDSGTGFSNPVAFFNNIFWQNEAFTYDPAGTDPPEPIEPTLVSQGFFDLEVLTAAGLFTPRTSVLTQLDPANFINPPGIFTNQIGVNPLFVDARDLLPFLDVGPSRFGAAGEIQTTLFRNDPPPAGKTEVPFDYHLTAASPVLTRLGGAAAQIWQLPIVLAPRCDIDRQQRPLLIAPRGADWLSTAAPVETCIS